MNNYCVYLHRNKINNKIYVGMTNNTEKRWRFNGIEYKPHNYENQNRPFWNAIQKYGWDNFEHIILCKGLSFEECCEKEKELIAKYNSTVTGYNVALGGNGGRVYKEHPRGMLGKHHTEENKRKSSERMRELNKLGKTGAVWKNGHPRGMLGKHQSEEYKERLRNIPAHKHPSARKVLVEFPDGSVRQWGCLKYLSEELNINTTTLIRIIKSGVPYKIPHQCYRNLDNLKKIENATIRYLDNTEITD